MFTGLIQDVGTVTRLTKKGKNTLLSVRTAINLSQVVVGDSIAIDGYCQTVVAIAGNVFTAEVSPETMARTTASTLSAGDKVNLEPALRLSDRLGGHLVSGHVDGVGTIEEIQGQDDFVIITVSAPPELIAYCIEKGSVAVDGVSLTINAVGEKYFQLGVIPHTLKATTLALKEAGDKVNIENDMIGKYVARFLSGFGVKPADHPDEKIDAAFLAKHGFLK